MKVISIVPKLAPSHGGVSDYAFRLAQQLKTGCDIDTHFIVCDLAGDGPAQLDEFPALHLSETTASSLSSALVLLENKEPSVVLLHLSGYGYAKWSLYYWLIKGLESWLENKHSCSNCVTMFHELYNSSKFPWKHSFWTYVPQKKLAMAAARLSHSCLTNCSPHQQEIQQWTATQNISLLPVFSNIGEPLANSPLLDRKRQLVVFGQRQSRIKVYQDSAREMSAFCKQLSIEKIIDIGAPTGLNLNQKFAISVDQLGQLSAEAVSKVMAESIAGWSNYPENYLEKSSIFAAYCSHGVVTVLNMKDPQKPRKKSEVAPPYLASYLFMNSNATKLSIEQLQDISTLAYDWYQGHTLREQSQVFAEVIAETSKTISATAALFPSL